MTMINVYYKEVVVDPNSDFLLCCLQMGAGDVVNSRFLVSFSWK